MRLDVNLYKNVFAFEFSLFFRIFFFNFKNSIYIDIIRLLHTEKFVFRVRVCMLHTNTNTHTSYTKKSCVTHEHEHEKHEKNRVLYTNKNTKTRKKSCEKLIFVYIYASTKWNLLNFRCEKRFCLKNRVHNPYIFHFLEIFDFVCSF